MTAVANAPLGAPLGALPSVYLPPSIRGFKPLHAPFSTWAHHQPFGYDLAAALRPKLLVELGTQAGLSYFTFCQAMKEHGVDGLAYAVDTWQGDEHTKAYDDEVYQSVAKHNRQYNGFSYLMRMLFQDALRHFGDATIDLLHIDGLHTYEAVSEDFRLWGPKVRPGGLVLFHDVRARLLDFGAWRFWDELEREHETFAFNHGFGLGVLRMPGGDRSDDPLLVRLLFEGSRADGGEALRAFYVHAVRFHELSRQAERAQAKKAERAVSTGPGGPGGPAVPAPASDLAPPQG
jgi:hypothetical protein